MNKSEITRNLKQIKKLLEEESPIIAKERIGFLINDIERERQYRSQQGKSDRQVANNHKILFWSVIGLVITFLVSLLFPWI
jgi:hypothetical protein|tara:strand:+ start:580 stop:822 length:243 start_codon:yes stop_codon:yes gene_type:complete